MERTGDHGAAYRVMDEQEVTIALCYQQPFDTWKARDNAKLIKAAPELLEACKAVRDGWEHNLSEAIALVNAAIAQAERG